MSAVFIINVWTPAIAGMTTCFPPISEVEGERAKIYGC